MSDPRSGAQEHGADGGGSGGARLAAPLLAFAAVEIAASFTTLSPQARHAASVTVATAVCWVLGSIPLGAASLLPLGLFPLLGVLPARTVAATYFDDVNFLFLGGMVLGSAIERWGLHRRISLGIVRAIGTSPRRIVLGFLVGTAFVSCWISNTATAVMMFPIAVATLEAGGIGRESPSHRAFGTALLLAIAYGANIGGIGTPIGTGPNFAFFGQFARGAPLGEWAAPSFLVWMAGVIPFVVMLCLVVWLVLTRVSFRVPSTLPGLSESFAAQTGRRPWSVPEIRVGLLFGLAVALWAGRSLLLGGEEWGWLRFFPEKLFADVPRAQAVSNSTVAIVLALLAFAIPAGDGRGSRLVGGDSLKDLPWDMLLLLGGGFAIARAFGDTGLSEWIGAQLGPGIGGWSPVLVVAAFCTIVTFLSEVTSNTATALVMLPIAADVGRSAGIDPRLPALAVTLSASLAFMLPIGTPPNAVVFSAGRIRMGAMARAGFLLNLLAVVLSTAVIFLWAAPILGIPTGGGRP